VKDNLRVAVAALAAVVVVCVVCAVALVAVFGQLRFDSGQTYRAEFSDVSGLAAGDFVRIAGVVVGKVKAISINDKSEAVVEFSTDASVILTQGSKAAVRWADPIGTRYLSLLEGAGETRRLPPGGTIPVQRTEPALDLDTLLGGFRPLFRALNPDQVNALSGQLIQALQGEGATIGTFLNQAAAVTGTLADRDQLIGDVITNLNTVLGSLGDQSSQFAKAVDSLTSLVSELAQRKTDVSSAIAHTNASSATIADLLNQARSPFNTAVAQSDRATSIVVADHEYFDNLLDTLPDAYRKLSRLGLYGDYFSFYFCNIILKLNGKGGQPVYVKVAGQDTGRCAPQ
jgi:phospholipid/cholesterol/gamma-HCH transport system substrate-binding protein